MTSPPWPVTRCCATSPSSARPSALCPGRHDPACQGVPRASIAGLRNVVVHEYSRVEPRLVLDIVEYQLADLAAALRT
nr:HepT-like ribonuclease domain-containing protein [Phycicoccus flavus]